MKSLKELYRIGYGPSSSHTMGPRAAAEQYLSRHPEAKRFKVTLYGSLAATGRGHLTDWAILDVIGKERCEIKWCAECTISKPTQESVISTGRICRLCCSLTV